MPRGIPNGTTKKRRSAALSRAKNAMLKEQFLSSLVKPNPEELRLDAPDYESKLLRFMTYANEAFDLAKLKSISIEWAEKNGFVDLDFSKVPDYEFVHIGKVFWIELNGGQVNDRIGERVALHLEGMKRRHFDSNNDSTVPQKTRRNPQERIRENTDAIIGNLDQALDARQFPSSPYEMMKGFDGGINGNIIVEYYEPLKSELEEVLKPSASPDLKEGYAHMTKKQLQAYLGMVKTIVDDAEKFVNSKRAERKPRATKVKAPSKIVENVKYQRESKELKITSIKPETILGAKMLCVFSTRYRRLGIYYADSDKGFTIKGTTIYGIDENKSVSKIVRKPEIVLTKVMDAGKVEIEHILKSINTTPTPLSGRLNDDTLILKKWN